MSVPIWIGKKIDKNGGKLKQTLDINKKLGTLGRGAYGSVKKVELVDGSIIAIKKSTQDADDGIPQDIIRETHSLRLLKGKPNIVQLYGMDININPRKISFSIALTFYKSDLKKFIDMMPQRVRIETLADVMDQLATGLAYMHEIGIIHRDIKPENILVDYDYDEKDSRLSNLKLYHGDFGLARQLACNPKDRNDTKKTKEVYTIAYRAPEVFFGVYDQKADIWALGIVLIQYIIVHNPVHISDFTDISCLLKITLLTGYDVPLYTLLKWLKTNKITEGLKDFLSSDKGLNVQRYIGRLGGVDKSLVSTISSMVTINAEKRPTAESISTKYKKSIVYRQNLVIPLRRIPMKPTLNYLGMTLNILKISKILNLNHRSIISAVDLFERYISNNLVDEDFIAVIMGCIIVSAKMCMIYPPGLESFVDLSNNILNDTLLMEAEKNIVEKMDWVLMSCDIDNYLQKTLALSEHELIKFMAEEVKLSYSKGFRSQEPYYKLEKRITKIIENKL